MEPISACSCSTPHEVAVSMATMPDKTILVCPRCGRKVTRDTKESAITAWNNGESDVARTPTFGSKPYHFLEGKLYDRHGKERDPREFVFFSVTDISLPELLDEYRQWCVETDSPPEHIDAATLLYHEVEAWQKGNRNKVHTAD